jgi:hypothetical protein
MPESPDVTSPPVDCNRRWRAQSPPPLLAPGENPSNPPPTPSALAETNWGSTQVSVPPPTHGIAPAPACPWRAPGRPSRARGNWGGDRHVLTTWPRRLRSLAPMTANAHWGLNWSDQPAIPALPVRTLPSPRNHVTSVDGQGPAAAARCTGLRQPPFWHCAEHQRVPARPASAGRGRGFASHLSGLKRSALPVIAEARMALAAVRCTAAVGRTVTREVEARVDCMMEML